MKAENLLIVGMLGAAAYLIYKTIKPASVPALYQQTKEVVFSALPGDESYGWKYYTDGVAIAPNGTYYLNGEAVWKPEGVE